MRCLRETVQEQEEPEEPQEVRMRSGTAVFLSPLRLQVQAERDFENSYRLPAHAKFHDLLIFPIPGKKFYLA